MKKIYSLALGLLMATCAFAQVDETFVFTDAEGNVVADGTTITVNNYIYDDFEQMLFEAGLFVKNNTEDAAIAGMTFEMTKIDNGGLSHCFPGSCATYTAVGKVVRAEGEPIETGESVSIQSEWIQDDKGECTVTYTIRVLEVESRIPLKYKDKAIGASVTVKYVYDENSKDVTGINDIKADVSDGKTFNIAGQRTSSNFQGIVIKDGKKFLNK